MKPLQDAPPISIRAMTDDDLPATTAIRVHPAVARNLLATPYESVERWRKLRETAPAVHMLVACAGSGVVGQAGIHPKPLPRVAHGAKLGIMVHPDWHGQGVGTALLAALTDLADNWLNLRRLELEVYPDNAPALALYEKFGFRSEGLLVRDAVRDGRLVDSLAMARLHGDLPRDTAPYPAPATPAPRGPFTLRAAEPADLDAVTNLMNQKLVRHGTLRAPYTTAAENRRLVDPTDPTSRAIVAVAGNEAVGLAMLQPGKGRRSHVGEIMVMAVHDAWHGRGIGNALLAAVLDLADNWLNLHRVCLTVLADNTAAVALYQRHGFVAETVNRAEVFRAGAYADSISMARFR
jgi:putative acetyltransferase